MMQHVSRIGAYLETGSDFAQLGCLLEDRDIMPCLQKACSRRQSPIPAPAMRILCFVTRRSYDCSSLILSSRSVFFFHLRVVAKNALLVEGQPPR